MEAPDFWDDPEKSQSKMKELKRMEYDVATYARRRGQYEDRAAVGGRGDEEYEE